ncbi:T9SS type A sorting domain-containing protein [Rhodocytophaga rosea]|uniref:T9SS type A sorting domain-containing protein n=1 Tax=Rhodocytophaga rosea TaxID=2704465 RepID=A0A6C0GTL9_9BACT|nr:Ig-like domain-containing protein [Rhodocytophaga rosea]QHT70883.1 T9SS type A sorting domain-containing protein [Rhodocytophaga rosea]
MKHQLQNPALKSSLYMKIPLIVLLTLLTIIQAFSQSGLHYTPEEITIWKQRANSTATQNTKNYRIAGDVQTNSPGDWERIKNRARLFLADPDYERYNGPNPSSSRTYIIVGDGPEPEYSAYTRRDIVTGTAYPANTTPPTGVVTVTLESGEVKGTLIRDAAFYYLITGDTQYRDAVRTELLAQAAVSNLDLSNTTRWQYDKLTDDAPGFTIAEWFTTYYFAYDYIKHTLSNSDKATLDEWFLNAAVFFKNNINYYIDGLFSNRSTNDNNDNYTINPQQQYRLSDTQGGPRVTHYNGYITYSFHRYFNNRRASAVRLYAMVGLGQNNTTLKTEAKKFVKDWLAYGVFPDGTPGDFERWSTTLPDLGWAYGMCITSICADIAEHFARQGDTDLFTHIENTGAAGGSNPNGNTSGGNKTILKTVQHLLQYQDGTLTRYGTDQPANTTTAYRIDGVNTASNWNSTFDTWFAKVNQYFKDDDIKAAYLRTNSGLSGYPSVNDNPRLANIGSNQPWSGVWQVYPGILFMSGQMEDLANPYLQVNITAPANNAIFPANSNIVINATATTPLGSVTKVEFYQGTTKLGEDSNSPYTYTWNNVAVGDYVLTAKAISSLPNVTRMSSSINISVGNTITRYEAETNYSNVTEGTATTSGTVLGVNCIDLSDGKYLRLADIGDKARINFSITQAGTYRIIARVRSGDVNGNQRYWPSGYIFTVNGTAATFTGDATTISSTASSCLGTSWWGNMQTANITLSTGSHYISIEANKTQGGIDYIEIEKISTGNRLSSSIDEEIAQTISIYPNPFSDTFTLNMGKSLNGVIDVMIVDVVGKIHYQASKFISTGKSEKTLMLSGKYLKQGVYFVKVTYEKDKQQVIRVIKQ